MDGGMAMVMLCQHGVEEMYGCMDACIDVYMNSPYRCTYLGR